MALAAVFAGFGRIPQALSEFRGVVIDERRRLAERVPRRTSAHELTYQCGTVMPSACVKVFSRGFQGRRRVVLLCPNQLCKRWFIAGKPAFGHETHVKRISLLRSGVQ